VRKIVFVSFILFILASSIYAGEFYNCIDRNGNSIITDSPQDGMKKCKLMESSEDEEQGRQERRTIRREVREEGRAIRREEREERRADREKPKRDKNCEHNCQTTYNSCVSDCTHMGRLYNESSCRYTCNELLNGCMSRCSD